MGEHRCAYEVQGYGPLQEVDDAVEGGAQGYYGMYCDYAGKIEGPCSRTMLTRDKDMMMY